MLEIGNSSKTADDGMGSGSLNIIDEEAVEAHHFHLSALPLIFHHQLHHFQPFGEIEQGMLGRIWRDGHNHLVKHAKTPCNDVGVAVRDGIKCAGIYTDFHEVTTSMGDDPY